MSKVEYEVGDFVEVLTSVRSDLIGKIFRVCQADSETVGLEGISKNPYLFDRHKVKLARKPQDSIHWSQPNLAGANCTNCSKFSEYQSTSFTCFECQKCQNN